MSFSPIFGPINPISVLQQFSTENRAPIWNTMGIVILTKAVVVVVLLWLTIKAFDHCLGRVPESRYSARKSKWINRCAEFDLV